MSKKIEYYTKRPPFINRIAEKKYLLEYFNSAPTNILFVYGPKSTGKTTLITKILKEELDEKIYAVSFLTMRGKIMKNFKDFKKVFFPQNLKGKIKDIVGGINLDLGFFKWTVDDESMLEEDVFGLMLKKLRKAKENGIKPVIILDEFQYLKEIYLTSEKLPEDQLIGELFKFFILITKVEKLAHVVCLTSDSYYMEELYSNTKLANTSDFYLMEHLSKKDIYYWLEDLEKLDIKIVDKIWNNLGGSVWEIWQVLVSYKNTGSYKEKLDDLLQVKYSLVAEWYDNHNEKTFDIKVEEKNTKRNKI
ncbi:MAG: ATP-binding protein [Candidatus Gracilibacteria bacterium]|nr:ATP-binding protein [Candidatus Gracilibacteria bacterium]